MSNYIGLFVGCVFILVSVMPVPIMRGRSGVPYKNQKLTRIVTAVLGFMILLLWLSFAKTPHEAILVHVTCYAVSLYVIDFTCALGFGEAQHSLVSFVFLH